jgi:hypothetical protein
MKLDNQSRHLFFVDDKAEIEVARTLRYQVNLLLLEYRQRGRHARQVATNPSADKTDRRATGN